MTVRVKFSADIYIKADTIAEARDRFETLPLFTVEAQNCDAEFSELELVEDADTYDDLMSEWRRANEVGRDKKVFLLDNEVYTKHEANDFTEDDLESLVSEETYTENFTIIKIDANSYNSVDEAIDGEGLFKDGYYIRSFGF